MDRIMMILPEDPPGFVVCTEIQKAAFENGFRLKRGVRSGWSRYGSTTALADVWIAGVSMNGPWLLSIDRREIGAEMEEAWVLETPGPGEATFVFRDLQGIMTPSIARIGSPLVCLTARCVNFASKRVAFHEQRRRNG
jgi:hypothetical protein